jgi:hypothetical protein
MKKQYKIILLISTIISVSNSMNLATIKGGGLTRVIEIFPFSLALVFGWFSLVYQTFIQNWTVGIVGCFFPIPTFQIRLFFQRDRMFVLSNILLISGFILGIIILK